MSLRNNLKGFAKNKLISGIVKYLKKFAKPIINAIVDMFTIGAKPKAKKYAKEAVNKHFDSTTEQAATLYKLVSDLQSGSYYQFVYDAYQESDNVLNAVNMPAKLYSDYLTYNKLNNMDSLVIEAPNAPAAENLLELIEEPKRTLALKM